MNKINALLFLVVFLLISCNPIMDVDNSNEECVIHFHFGGDISSSDELMTKTITDNDLLFIQIFRGNSPYASGVFDNTSMKLNLKRGTDTYRVQAFLIKEGKTWSYTDANGKQYHFYSDGYINCMLYSSNAFYSANPYTGGLTGSYDLKLNYFYYNSVGTIRHRNGIASNTAAFFQRMDIATCDEFDVKYLECIDWLYGESEGFIANNENDIWNVDLKRVGFKLKYELSGVTDGEVTVTIANSDKTFFQETVSSVTYESATKFYAFYEARNAWLYADNYSENLTVSVSWLRGIGVTQDLGSTTVQVLRNCLNNIKITLGSDDRSAGMSLSVEPESSIGSSAVTIPLE